MVKNIKHKVKGIETNITLANDFCLGFYYIWIIIKNLYIYIIEKSWH